jgi:hypothetical protein
MTGNTSLGSHSSIRSRHALTRFQATTYASITQNRILYESRIVSSSFTLVSMLWTIPKSNILSTVFIITLVLYITWFCDTIQQNAF